MTLDSAEALAWKTKKTNPKYIFKPENAMELGVHKILDWRDREGQPALKFPDVVVRAPMEVLR